MAHVDEGPVASPYMDYAEHERTYRRFLGLAKNVMIAVIVLLVLMAYFLV